jgi:tRNA pseudouridine synthase 9
MEKNIYLIQDGFRFVIPYEFVFRTYTKGRWVGKNIYDVFINEFKAYSQEYYVTY